MTPPEPTRRRGVDAPRAGRSRGGRGGVRLVVERRTGRARDGAIVLPSLADGGG